MFVALCYSVVGMKANCKKSISGFLKKLKVLPLVSYSTLQLIVLFSLLQSLRKSSAYGDAYFDEQNYGGVAILGEQGNDL